MDDGSSNTVRLLGGAEMPVLGLGTYPLDNEQVEPVVERALEIGYRLFDTAESYGNEAGVGRALEGSGIDRSELFVTTKFNVRWHGEDLVREAFQRSAERLRFERIDQLMIHWPNPARGRFVDAWRGLIRLRDEGLVRSIGVANFKSHHLQRLLDETGVAPDVNQIELNPFADRSAARAFHEEHGIATEAWAPLGKGGELLDDPVIAAIGERHGRTPAQVVLRWSLQLGNVVIPKTKRRERLLENFSVFDFTLAANEMEALGALSRGESAVTLDSDEFGH